QMTAQEQAFELGRAWEAAPEPKRQFVFQVVRPDLTVDSFRIGPHTPSMKAEDVHLIHRLWLQITREQGLDKVHHHEILTQALTRFARDYVGHDRESILNELRRGCESSAEKPPADLVPPASPAQPGEPSRRADIQTT